MEIKMVMQFDDAEVIKAEHERDDDVQVHEDQEDHCPWQGEKPACKILLLAPGLAGPGRRFKRRLCLWRGQGGTSLAHCPLPIELNAGCLNLWLSAIIHRPCCFLCMSSQTIGTMLTYMLRLRR